MERERKTKQEHMFHINYFSQAVFCQTKIKPKNLFSYLQHQNNSLHYIPLRLPAVDDDCETASFALLAVEIKQDILFSYITQIHVVGPHTMNQLQRLRCGGVVKQTHSFVLWWHFKNA